MSWDSSESVQHLDIETLIKKIRKVWQAPGLISPTFVDVDHLFEIQGRRISRLVRIRLCSRIQSCSASQVRELLDLWSSGFFTGALRWAKLLLHARNCSSFSLSDLL